VWQSSPEYFYTIQRRQILADLIAEVIARVNAIE